MDRKYNIYCDSNYVLSRGDNKLSPEHYKLVEKIYKEEIIDLFGETDEKGRIIKPGKITFFEDRINPEGIRQYLLNYAKDNGEFITEPYVVNKDGKKHTFNKIVAYKENDPELYTVVIIDHVSLLSRERGFTLKENIDKVSDHMVWFRNLCRFTPVVVSQFNRELAKTERLKFSGEQLQPSSEDFKNSGNIVEDASMVIALFNPTNYPHLDRHLGYDLKRIGKSYRSAHILASRNTETNVNLSLVLEGKTGEFKELPKSNEKEGLEQVYKYLQNKKLN